MKFYELKKSEIPVLKFSDLNYFYLQVILSEKQNPDNEGETIRYAGLRSDPDEYPMFDRHEWEKISKVIRSFLEEGVVLEEDEINP